MSAPARGSGSVAEPPSRSYSRRARAQRAWQAGELRGLVVLVPLVIALGAAIGTWPSVLPLNVMVIPLVLGSLFLGPRELPWFVVLSLAAFAVGVARQEAYTPRILLSMVVIFALSLIVMLTSFRRSRLGVAGVLGESMLVDLRDRILKQGQLPPLPGPWHAESAIAASGGSKFAGDFVVAGLSEDGTRLGVCVVDVSGKGAVAGTRALLLSGAFSGLLGALPPDRFLPAANQYLLRQDWLEDFATAVHLAVDLTTGDFEVRTAGHPPAAQLHAGSGRWEVHQTRGAVLGLLPDETFEPARGTLRPGDALLLYTDGMVETTTRDLDSGIDRLLGHAERLQRDGFDGGATRLIAGTGSRSDDRAVLLVHRRPSEVPALT